MILIQEAIQAPLACEILESSESKALRWAVRAYTEEVVEVGEILFQARYSRKRLFTCISGSLSAIDVWLIEVYSEDSLVVDLEDSSLVWSRDLAVLKPEDQAVASRYGRRSSAVARPRICGRANRVGGRAVGVAGFGVYSIVRWFGLPFPVRWRRGRIDIPRREVLTIRVDRSFASIHVGIRLQAHNIGSRGRLKPVEFAVVITGTITEALVRQLEVFVSQLEASGERCTERESAELVRKI